MSKIMFPAIMISAIALAACTPQEHQTLAAYRHAETRIALPADPNCYNKAFDAWTVADANQGALSRLRLDEIYSNPNLPPASPAANRATDDVFALYERLMQYHPDHPDPTHRMVQSQGGFLQRNLEPRQPIVRLHRHRKH